MYFSSNLMFNSSLCFPTHITSVLSMFIFRPYFLNISFHYSVAPCNSSRCSATITRSSAYIFFLELSLVLIFLLISSITKMKSNGLRAQPCLKPIFTWNSFDKPDPTTTLHVVLSCIASTIFTSDSGAPIYLKVAIGIFLATGSKAFSRSTKAKAIASPISSRIVVLVRTSHQWSLVLFLNPGCSAPTSCLTLSCNLLSRILSSNFIVWLSRVVPLYFPVSCCMPFTFPYGDN